MKRKLAVILAATMVLNSFTVPAFANDYVDVVAVEDDGYEEEITDIEEDVDFDVENNADDSADFFDENEIAPESADFVADEGYADVEVEEGFEEEAGDLADQDTEANLNITWKYSNGLITADYTKDAKTGKGLPANFSVKPADLTSDDPETNLTYIKNTDSFIYNQITVVEGNETRVTTDFLPDESWQTYVTASFEDPSTNVQSGDRTFFLYDAVLNGNDSVSDYNDLPQTVYYDFINAPTCISNGTADVYTIYLLPEVDGKYNDELESLDDLSINDIVSITVTRNQTVKKDVRYHKWAPIDWQFHNIFNVKEVNSVPTLIDPDYPGWYAYVAKNTCLACKEVRYLVQRENDATHSILTDSGYNENLVKWDYITYKGKTYEGLNWVGEKNGKSYSYYIPAETSDFNMGWARNFENIRRFTTKDGSIFELEYENDDKTEAYRAKNGYGKVTAITLIKAGTSSDPYDVTSYPGFYKYEGPGKAISTNEKDFLLINCKVEGSYIKYTGRSAFDQIRDDSSHRMIYVNEHCTPDTAKKLIYVDYMPYVIIRDGSGNLVYDPSMFNADATSFGGSTVERVYNYKQYTISDTNKYIACKNSKVTLKDDAKLLGFLIPASWKVYDAVCNREIYEHLITRCICEEHPYSTNISEVWNEISRTSTLLPYGEHQHNQPVRKYNYIYDEVANDKLYDVMYGLRNGGYILQVPVDAVDWATYRDEQYQLITGAHFPAVSKFVIKYPVFARNGSIKEWHQVDLTGDKGLIEAGLVQCEIEKEDSCITGEDGLFKLTFLCNICGKFVDETDAVVKAHKSIKEVLPTQIDYKEPTCTEEGEETVIYRCLVCGVELDRKTTVFKKIPHNFSGKTVIETSGNLVVARDDGLLAVAAIDGKRFISETALLEYCAKQYALGNRINLITAAPQIYLADNAQVGLAAKNFHVSAVGHKYCTYGCGTAQGRDYDITGIYVTKLVVDDRNGGTIELLWTANNADSKAQTAVYFSDRTAYEDRVNPEVEKSKEIAIAKQKAEKAAAEALMDPTAEKIAAAQNAIDEAEALGADTTKAKQDLAAAKEKAAELARKAKADEVIAAAQKLSKDSTDAEIKAVEDAAKAANLTAGEAALVNQYIQAAKDAKARKAAEEEAKKKAEEEAKKRAAELAAAQKVAAAKTSAENIANDALTAANAALSNPTDANIALAKNAVANANANINTAKAAGADTAVAAKTVALANTAIASAEKQKKAAVPTISFGNSKVRKALVPGGHITNRIILKKGQTLKIKAKASDGSKVYYRAINDKLISCSKSGKVKAKKAGRTRVLVTTKNGAKYEVLFRVKK